ncbi:hypothetical protein ES702_03920 [subsurface metagenome]
MIINVNRERGYPVYECPKCNDDFFCYKDLKDHIGLEHYNKRVIQTNFNESSFDHFSLVKKGNFE